MKRFLLLFFLFLNVGCFLTKTKAPLTRGRVEQDKKVATIEILYGTDRKVKDEINGNVHYLSNNSYCADEYKVGYTLITIPIKKHEEGEIESPSFFKLQFSKNPTKYIVNKQTVQLSNEEFNAILKNIRNGSEAFIFVHGYNNSFEDAAKRTAQLRYDIRMMEITPMMFSWSSNARMGKYPSDSLNVLKAVAPFISFMKRVAANKNFKKIHLIAHSMGNKLISEAFYTLKDDPITLKFDQIIMAAPDLKAPEFKAKYAAAIKKRANRVTVYSAKNDWALKASRKFFDTAHLNRLGLVSRPPFTVDSIDIIDASDVKTDFLGHGRFAQSETILEDMSKLFKNGLSPKDRALKYDTLRNYFFERYKRRN